MLRIPRSLFLKMLEGFPDAARKLRDNWAARTERRPAISTMCAAFSMRTSRNNCARRAKRVQAPAITRYTSSVAVTGTWSDGRVQPRASLQTSMSATRSASAGETQM